MFVQNFIKLGAAVYKLSCPQREEKKKNFATMLKTMLSSLAGTVNIAYTAHMTMLQLSLKFWGRTPILNEFSLNIVFFSASRAIHRPKHDLQKIKFKEH